MTRPARLGRTLLCALAPIATMLGASAEAAYPERPVTMIVAWTAGGATDLVARGIQDTFQKALGTQIVVKNVPGAAGTLGTAEAARAIALKRSAMRHQSLRICRRLLPGLLVLP